MATVTTSYVLIEPLESVVSKHSELRVGGPRNGIYYWRHM